MHYFVNVLILTKVILYSLGQSSNNSRFDKIGLPLCTIRMTSLIVAIYVFINDTKIIKLKVENSYEKNLGKFNY